MINGMFAGILGVYAMFRPNAPCSTNLLSLLCLQVAESCAFLHRDVKHATTAFFDYGNAESSAFDSVGLCRSTLIKTCCEGRPSSYMEVYKNDGTPKSSILMEFSIIDHLAIGVPPFLETLPWSRRSAQIQTSFDHRLTAQLGESGHRSYKGNMIKSWDGKLWKETDFWLPCLKPRGFRVPICIVGKQLECGGNPIIGGSSTRDGSILQLRFKSLGMQLSPL